MATTTVPTTAHAAMELPLSLAPTAAYSLLRLHPVRMLQAQPTAASQKLPAPAKPLLRQALSHRLAPAKQLQRHRVSLAQPLAVSPLPASLATTTQAPRLLRGSQVTIAHGQRLPASQLPVRHQAASQLPARRQPTGAVAMTTAQALRLAALHRATTVAQARRLAALHRAMIAAQARHLAALRRATIAARAHRAAHRQALVALAAALAAAVAAAEVVVPLAALAQEVANNAISA